MTNELEYIKIIPKCWTCPIWMHPFESKRKHPIGGKIIVIEVAQSYLLLFYVSFDVLHTLNDWFVTPFFYSMASIQIDIMMRAGCIWCHTSIS